MRNFHPRNKISHTDFREFKNIPPTNDANVLQEQINLMDMQKALLNILDDYSEERYRAEDTQRALLNILEDSAADKINMENIQRAVLNILDDYCEEKYLAEDTQRALLNILEDSAADKMNMENIQRAVLNILDDYLEEKIKVESINIELISVNKELEAFSYSVSHDLRAPLRAVNGYAQILNEDYGTKLDTEGKRIIETISHNALKMGTLIDELLSFSRLGRKELQKTEINMNELTEKILIDQNISISNTVKIKIGKLHNVKGDYGLLHQVMFNLISNALKYSSKKTHPFIEIFSEEIKDEIIFSVKDNGAGFNMEYYDKLFGVFQRLHMQDEFEGTGVGLAITQRIIMKHGGKVWAEGIVDNGATFNFSLAI
ncbi:His Kinase A (phospho-acceptor) domain-containing protein [Chitinophaga sp. CF118]|uniref:sensor histidine kinase n=1 Tax=Chitinophaga sp. CF118 TaxID=1884367 RepID=UPI0008EEC404|nr:ATP-binding protein [Chitinophaga sp. CF118]SFD47963.1 His Kinase A (phospho-acceptor) domain-containing protein [Chitinophaga sp. CF118]